MLALKPTVYVAVPRVLTRIYSALRGAFAKLDDQKKALLEIAMNSKRKWLAKGVYKSFYDPFFFWKCAAAIGGRVNLVATGSAPIDPAMLEFFRIAFSCPVIEGYGMTEVFITNLSSHYDVETRSHVGPPNTSVEIKLQDIPDMNYFSNGNPPRGEVCMRGPMVMSGYYKDAEKTKEVIDEEGWFHSGGLIFKAL